MRVLARQQSSLNAVDSNKRRWQSQNTPQRPAPRPAAPTRRVLSLVALPLAFLPWRGCDEGGFYSTGVTGNHGDACQKIYQPAAQAEKRFAEQQQKTAAAAAAAAAEDSEQAAAATAVPLAPQPAAETEREERATLRKEQGAYERAAMDAEQAQRTQVLVDSMWQSLE